VQAESNPITHRAVGHVIADRGDDACAFHAERHRQRRLVGMRSGIGAIAHVDVHEIDSRICETDHYLVGPGGTFGHLMKPALFRPAKCLDTDSFHGSVFKFRKAGESPRLHASGVVTALQGNKEYHVPAAAGMRRNERVLSPRDCLLWSRKPLCCELA